MAKGVDYKKPAELVWADVSKVTSGVDYLRGKPSFKGTLAEAVRRYAELPRSNQPFARISTGRQQALENKTVLTATEIEAIKRRKDFPKA